MVLMRRVATATLVLGLAAGCGDDKKDKKKNKAAPDRDTAGEGQKPGREKPGRAERAAGERVVAEVELENVTAELTVANKALTKARKRIEELTATETARGGTHEAELAKARAKLRDAEERVELEVSRRRFVPALMTIAKLEPKADERAKAVAELEKNLEKHRTLRLNRVRLNHLVKTLKKEAPGRKYALKRLDLIRSYESKMNYLYNKFMLPIVTSEDLASEVNRDRHRKYRAQVARLTAKKDAELDRLDHEAKSSAVLTDIRALEVDSAKRIAAAAKFERGLPQGVKEAYLREKLLEKIKEQPRNEEKRMTAVRQADERRQFRNDKVRLEQEANKVLLDPEASEEAKTAAREKLAQDLEELRGEYGLDDSDSDAGASEPAPAPIPPAPPVPEST